MKTRRLIALFIAIVLTTPVSGVLANDNSPLPDAGAEPVTEILIRHRPKPGTELSLPTGWSIASHADDALVRLGVTRISRLRSMSSQSSGAVATASAALAALRSKPEVQYAVPNYRRKLLTVQSALPAAPDDPHYAEQWYLPAIGIPNAWDALTALHGGLASLTQVTVAVIDTGLNQNHPDFSGQPSSEWPSRVLQGRNFVSVGGVVDEADLTDNIGHGTMVSGIIAANTGNQIGISGIAPNARILPVKVFDRIGGVDYGGDDASICAAIMWAADYAADVINLSLGGEEPSEVLRDALRYARSRGCVVIAAAGNEGAGQILYPAAYPETIAVGSATNSPDTDYLGRAVHSNFGMELDILAPGTSIASTHRSGGVSTGTGTSYAVAIASGVSALLIGSGPQLKGQPALTQWLLEATAKDTGGAGFDEYCGRGTIDAYAAATRLLQVGNPLPTGDIYEPNGDAQSLGAGHPAILNLSQVSELVPPLTLVPTLHLPGDTDTYRLEIPSPGWLAVSVQSPEPTSIVPALTVPDGRSAEFRHYATPGGQSTSWLAVEAGTYYLRISDAFSRWAAQPYSLQVGLYGYARISGRISLQSKSAAGSSPGSLDSVPNMNITLSADGTFAHDAVPAHHPFVLTGDAPAHARVKIEVMVDAGANREVVLYLPYGDQDGSGNVDLRDLAQMCLAYGSRIAEARFSPLSDPNADGVIDLLDIVTVARNLGQGEAQPETQD